MTKISAFRLRRLAVGRLAEASSRIPALRRRCLARFTAGLRDLNDAIEGTELAGHYWVWGGLLLGWARDGAVLPHDCFDADFGVTDEDFELLVRAVPAILAAGFKCDRRFVTDSGLVTELTFTRRGARYEFFRMFPENGRLRYYLYNLKLTEVTEIEAALPDQPVVPFTFLDRSWLKHADHALELRTTYGKWEVPDPSWSYLDGQDIETRRVSGHSHSDFDWRDPASVSTDGAGLSPAR
jgi:hypothetical protein